jgi:hypothetical protein
MQYNQESIKAWNQVKLNAYLSPAVINKPTIKEPIATAIKSVVSELSFLLMV